MSAILLGFDALKLKLYLAAEPQIQAQLGKLSAVSLGKSAEETESSEDKNFARKGAAIKAQLEDSLRFSLMPEFMRAAWVREHGYWPGQDGSASKPVRGLEPALARELIQFSQLGLVGGNVKPNDETSSEPSVWRVIGRLYATVKA